MARQLVRRTTLAALTTTAVLGLLTSNASAAEPEPFARKWRVVVKCQLVRINPYGVLKYIDGTGTGTTYNSAETNALQHVDTKVPVGHYKRHCDDVLVERFIAPPAPSVALAAG
ncbi:hypothetical protein [Streptomyces triculaminicus]|uniref:hypothetical protein n=1 Tax=Streptomyces triculaminicus TaxID=2816232 RepID=UPI0037CDDA1F